MRGRGLALIESVDGRDGVGARGVEDCPVAFAGGDCGPDCGEQLRRGDGTVVRVPTRFVRKYTLRTRPEPPRAHEAVEGGTGHARGGRRAIDGAAVHLRRVAVASACPGRPEAADQWNRPQARVQLASPGYFDVMRLRLRAGRRFTRLDSSGSPRVAVVNESLERELFDGASAVGRRLRLRRDDELREIVGVVADVKYENLAVAESSPEVYLPMHQSESSPVPIMNAPFVSVRTSANPLSVVPFLREAVADVYPGAALDDVATMETRLASSFVRPRFQAVFIASFGAVALLLAMLGVYGQLSHTVAQRRGEIGIRMALGAQSGHVLALVFQAGWATDLGAALLRRRLFRLFIGVFARRRSLSVRFARGQRPGQRPPASFGRPARPESRCPDASVVPSAPLNIRAAFWYDALGREMPLRWP